MEGKLVNLANLARSLGVPRQWLQKEAIRGAIPCILAEKKMLFNLDAVERCLAAMASENRLVAPEK